MPAYPVSYERSEGRRFCFYRGASMWPVLREPAVLEVHPYQGRRIRVGDVIVFRSVGVTVAHRVVGIHAEGVRTRGDNVPQNDPHLCPLLQIRGQVVNAWQGTQRRRVFGGWLGRLSACLLPPWCRVLKVFVALVRPCYHRLAGSGIIVHLLPAHLRPRVVRFGGGGRCTLQLVQGRRTVGYFDAARGRWAIRRPYRLLVNSQALEEIDTSPARR